MRTEESSGWASQQRFGFVRLSLRPKFRASVVLCGRGSHDELRDQSLRSDEMLIESLRRLDKVRSRDGNLRSEMPRL